MSDLRDDLVRRRGTRLTARLTKLIRAAVNRDPGMEGWGWQTYVTVEPGLGVAGTRKAARRAAADLGLRAQTHYVPETAALWIYDARSWDDRPEHVREYCLRKMAQNIDEAWGYRG